MNLIHLLRMAKWGRNPPSEKKVKFVFAVILICVALAGIEYFIGFPDGIFPESNRRHILR